MSTRRVLIIEDDRETADHIAAVMTADGWSAETAVRIADGRKTAQAEAFDLVICDRMLPDGDGLSLIADLRAAGVATPVLILSTLGRTEARVEGLESGADDYLPKPFEPAELLARAHAVLRRATPQPHPEILTCGDIEIRVKARTVHRAGRHVALSPKEFELLRYLARNEGRLVTRTMLLEHVWKLRFDPQTNVVDVHVSRLRRKIEDGFDTPVLLTVRGEGYMLKAAE